MSRGRRRTRRSAVLATAAVTALLLTGCSAHLDAGSAGADTMESELSRIDGVATVSASGLNNLPFAGTASASVVTDDDLSDADLRRVTDAVGSWVTSHDGGVSYSASIEADGFWFSVESHASENRRVLGVIDGLRGDDRWAGGRVTGGDDSHRLELEAADPSDLLAAWTAVQRAAGSAPWDVSASATAWNDADHGRFSEPDYRIQQAGGDPSAEVSAWQRVAAEHRVTGLAISPGNIHVHLDRAADVADATRIVERAAPDTAALVDGGIIRKSGDSSGVGSGNSSGAGTGDSSEEPPAASAFAEADRLAAVADRPGATAIDERPDSVTVTASGAEDALRVADALVAAKPRSPVTAVGVRSSGAATEDRDSDGLLVRGSPDRFAAAVTSGRGLVGFLPAEATYFDTSAVQATVAEPGDAAALVRAVGPSLPDGSRFTIDLAGDADHSEQATFAVHGDDLDLEEPYGYQTPGADRETIVAAAQGAWRR